MKASNEAEERNQGVSVRVCLRDENDTPENALARTLLNPAVHAAASIRTLENKDWELSGLINELSGQVKAVNDGDLSQVEGMLLTQAYTLNELFNGLAKRAHVQKEIKLYEAFLRLSLKAQIQCRTTLETLAAIKNPPIVYARQANIANGPQQVNNGMAADPRMRESEKAPNKLLEEIPSERLDFGTTQATSGIDKALETVGQGNRAEVSRREG